MVDNRTNFSFIDDISFRNKLSKMVDEAKSNRMETQKEVSDWTGISLTKIKQIENGTCVDFNAINNYLNYLGAVLKD